ncbi:unnamed protein product [Durusdinium trenchii]|uniref:Uncharacterized protein n=1 Tax=Durusdinium trenchii TaxID=1381693 RepID=A0ABP0NVT9_9DINO
MKGYLLIGYFCVAASYRQQLPAAGFAAELDSGERVRQILEPCEMVHLDIDVPRGNVSFSMRRHFGTVGLPLPRDPVPVRTGATDRLNQVSKDGPKVAVMDAVRLASLAREELTIFGAEVMLGAAICVGAALQRRRANL